MRLLLVEDYPPLRKSLARGLREAGFAVDVTGDGEEGLWYAPSNEYDAIVLDLMLLRMDGLTILRRQPEPHVHYRRRDHRGRQEGLGVSGLRLRLRRTSLWVRCADAEDAAAKSKTRRRLGGGGAIVKKPVAAYVEKMYEEGNFSQLGIGT